MDFLHYTEINTAKHSMFGVGVCFLLISRSLAFSTPPPPKAPVNYKYKRDYVVSIHVS